MPKTLKPFFETELEEVTKYLLLNNFNLAWEHLESAHIPGQKYPVTHHLVHWEMLKFGIRIKDLKEIAGQIPRLVFGGVKSFVGKVPAGNPGGVNVPPLKTLPLKKDLQKIFKSAGI